MTIAYLKQIRVSHWLKNILILFPIFLTNNYNLIDLDFFLIFMSFSLLSSTFYCLNDYFDFKKDREHNLKKNRPYVSGKINRKQLFGLILITFILSALLFLIADKYNLAIYFISYILLNIFYNFILKDLKFVDLLTLVFFYFIRIEIGSKIYSIDLSIWINTVILVIFLELAIFKRLYDILKIKDKKSFFKKYSFRDIKFFNFLLILNALVFCILIISYSFNEKAQFLNLDLWKFYLIITSIVAALVRIYFIITKQSTGKSDFFEIVISDTYNYFLFGFVMLVLFYS